jgi:hypothetical protein
VYKEVVIMWKNKERSVDSGVVFSSSMINTLQKIVAHDFQYDRRSSLGELSTAFPTAMTSTSSANVAMVLFDVVGTSLI